MKAIVYAGPSRLSVEDIPVPEPKPGQVLVRLKSAGICGSDVNYIKGEFQYSKIPIIPGHEGAGVVEIAEDSSELREGDRVVINYVSSCGECEYCKIGRDNLCNNVELIGFDRDGTWAEYIIVPEKSLIKLPDNISFEEGAISGCALVTPFHAIKISRLSPGESVAIIGLGGVGINAVPIARMMGASKIIGVDIHSPKLEVARKYGADLVVNPLETDPVEVVKEETGGVDVSFEFVGSINTILQALKITKKGGRVVLVGLIRSSLILPLPDLLFNEKAIITSIDHTREDLKELLGLMERRVLNFQNSISGVVDIAQVPKLINEMVSGRYSGLRTVIRF